MSIAKAGKQTLLRFEIVSCEQERNLVKRVQFVTAAEIVGAGTFAAAVFGSFELLKVVHLFLRILAS